MFIRWSATYNDGNPQGPKNICTVPFAAVDFKGDYYFGHQFEPNNDHVGDRKTLLKNLYNIKLKEGVYKVTVPVVVYWMYREHSMSRKI